MCAVLCAPPSTLCVVRNVLISGARRVVRRCAGGPLLIAMTTSTDLLGQLRREWRRLGCSSDARVALALLVDRHGDLGLEHLTDLGDVVAALEARSGRNVLERAAIVRALLEESRHPLLRRTLLQTMLPGIVSVCRQLRFGDGIIRDPSETVAMAVSLASELLVDWAGQSRQFAAPDILSALRGRLRRWLLKEKEALRSVSAYDQNEEPAAASSPLETRLNSYRGSQYDRLARLTYARVFEGRSLRELARDDHSAPSSLQAELQHFAIRFLI